jgi:hypothetical protein
MLYPFVFVDGGLGYAFQSKQLFIHYYQVYGPQLTIAYFNLRILIHNLFIDLLVN